ncbi:glycosyltransferase [Kaistella sp.]|uniref:glycosyltransferase n=1 Tax=Kaistella sp. TaxID=2782235 RepID=UPI002F94A29B
MISVIISSYQPEYFTALEKNIAETVGVPYEIIKIDNPGLMGICKAYNTGAQLAKFDNLLFIHEDILFHTQNWGEKLISHLQDPETGIIGVAGSDYVPVAPSGWFINNDQHQFLHLIQNNKKGNEPKYYNQSSHPRQRVYALDGVFLGINKLKFNDISFNEDLQGFHAYDLDISLNAATKYNNYVINDILIEHFSIGSPDKSWLEGVSIVRKIYGSSFQEKSSSKIELDCFENYLFAYFKAYHITAKNMLITLNFLPFSRTTIKEIFYIAKLYYRYFKYKNYYKTKFYSI